VLIPKLANPRFTSPTKSTTAKIMVRVDECSQTNSLRINPVVPMMMRAKPAIFRKFRISELIIAYFHVIFSHPAALAASAA
jgi:hypothetical protein